MAENRFVYVDNAATTMPHPEVVEAMNAALVGGWGNPSSLHAKGREAKHLIDGARERIASCLGCAADEIYFTSCGTESDNWAIKGSAAMSTRRHIITTKFEHPAVLNSCKALAKQGYTITYADIKPDGIVDVECVKKALADNKNNTAIVAIMLANNEIGTIQPVAEIAKLAHEAGALMFTDAVQAVGAIPVNVKELGVDMLSLSGHKLHAPKGIGALYIKKGTRIANLIDGGGQEKGKRSGTENMPYILALAKAVEIAYAKLPDEERVKAMRDRLIDTLLTIPHSRLNGSREHRLPGNLNISFEYIEGESMLLLLDMAGICVSTGSACSSSSLEPSHVLMSIGLPAEVAHGSVRISLCHDNTDADVDYILEKLPGIVNRLREMSPIYPGN